LPDGPRPEMGYPSLAVCTLGSYRAYPPRASPSRGRIAGSRKPSLGRSAY
jgi:hypothetical protein